MKAIALFSGGLDSMLAVRLIQEQGIEVVGLAFTSPFFGPEKARRSAEQLGILLQIVDLTEDLTAILLKPKYGYGRWLNPCIDCHALMAKKAGELMDTLGASFIITGEVLGERPKSQNATALHIVARDSGVDGYLLRPLSAKLLPPTIPEEKGWVDRESLQAIRGRSRKPQMALAEKYGFKNYPSPAGGCLLTEPEIAKRLKNLLAANPSPAREDLELVKYGRHFQVDGALIVVARQNKDENGQLIELSRPGDYLLQLKEMPVPQTLVRGTRVNPDVLQIAAALTVRYSKARDLERASIILKEAEKDDAWELQLDRFETEELLASLKREGT